MNMDDEIPRCRNKSPKKKFSVTWTWTGDRSKLSPLMKRYCYRDWTERYVSAKAASQAIERKKQKRDWISGPEWVARIDSSSSSCAN